MATSSIRTKVRDEIIDRLNAHSALVSADGNRVPVDPGPPGQRIEREHVFVARTTGRRQVAFLEAGRKTVEDDFTITFVFWASRPGDTGSEADDRVEQMATSIEDVLADDPTLGNLDGLFWAVEATVEGPDHELTKEGAVATIVVDVECKARYE